MDSIVAGCTLAEHDVELDAPLSGATVVASGKIYGMVIGLYLVHGAKQRMAQRKCHS